MMNMRHHAECGVRPEQFFALFRVDCIQGAIGCAFSLTGGEVSGSMSEEEFWERGEELLPDKILS